eukprot:TRINITY_DN110_c0_g1_i1.p1 TRINITY_DN110_c0_g1~~TRINITY_DN110_c0_g1_i1.p1  ORF type:complete len:479 (-),score=145.25 TRINITY_DN110_c0_g1_i1:61-1497(-)
MHGAVAVVVCLLVSVCLGAVPGHTYLSLTGELSTMRVTFITDAAPTTAASVTYGTGGVNQDVAIASADVHVFKRNASSTQYVTTATLGPLKPGQTYTYQVRLEKANSTWGEQYTFVAPQTGPVPITFGIYGDLGGYGAVLTSNSTRGLKAFSAAHKLDLIMHNGDLAYNLGSRDGLVGEEFMAAIKPVSTRVPYMVIPGNHEYMNDGLSHEYYLNFFNGQVGLGAAAKSTNPLLWYSFDIGCTHVVAFDTETVCEDHTKIPTQLAWLEQDLANARTKNPEGWIVVLGHRQIYDGHLSPMHSLLMRFGMECTNPETFSTCNPLKPCTSSTQKGCGFALEPLLFKYKVDIVWVGHVHEYTRHFPIGPDAIFETQAKDMYVNPKYPVHVISGAAGTQSSPEEEHVATLVGDASPVAFTSGAKYSFSVMTVHNYTHIEVHQVDPTEAEPLDVWWVVKNKNLPPWNKTDTFSLTKTTATVCDQ